MKTAVVLGTRPEIIKLSPVIRELDGSDFFIIHTNQHYSASMDSVFFHELNLPQPKYNLGISNESLHGKMVGKMLEKVEEILISEKPDVELVQGDTNTALAGALAAAKLQIPIAHVEAGLRSYDRTMPEEINRVIIDHLSAYLFAPTPKQKKILINEGISENLIFVVGNTITDAVTQNLVLAEKKDIKHPGSDYILVTMHRPSNVDTQPALKKQIANLERLSAETGIKIVFPIHPRTRKKLKDFSITVGKSIEITEPVGYFEMLILEKNAKLIVTDSGGIQEEACILGVPCITLRTNTERPETVEVGASVLAGDDESTIISAAHSLLKKTRDWKNPFGDGHTSKRIVDILAG